MEPTYYKRKIDNKIFRVVRVVEVFVGMISWYDGPLYEKEYTLVDSSNIEEIIPYSTLLLEFEIISNKLTNMLV